mgnify:CR=1 FL=1|tara:strand:+ start:250 stop:666 length:417 start_codon:yes stop_codon:yes gene_type:complete
MDKLQTRILPRYLHAIGEFDGNNGTVLRSELIVPIGSDNKVFIKAESTNATIVNVFCLDAGHSTIGTNVKDAVIKLTCVGADRGRLIKDLTNVIAGVGTDNPNDGTNVGVIKLDGNNLSGVPSSVAVSGIAIEFDANA